MPKHRFQILILPPAYSPEEQARVPAALCVIHKIIWKLDLSEGNSQAENISFVFRGIDEDINAGSDSRRDKIAEDIWKDYQKVLSERGMLDEIDEDSEQELFDSDKWDGEEEDY